MNARGRLVKRGTSALLNYRVMAYGDITALPASALENTIGIITSLNITDVYFQADEPDAVLGRIWILTRPYALREFNALKTADSLVVSPTSYVKQYDGSSWVYKDSRIYQSGSWKTLELIVYKNGDVYALTGGWSSGFDHGTYLYMQVTVSENNTGMNNTPIDLSKVPALRVYCDVSSGVTRRLYISPTTSSSSAVMSVNLVAGWNSIDVSALTGSYYLIFYVAHDTSATYTVLQVSRIEEDATT